jgi:hypothetical protein
VEKIINKKRKIVGGWKNNIKTKIIKYANWGS